MIYKNKLFFTGLRETVASLPTLSTLADSTLRLETSLKASSKDHNISSEPNSSVRSHSKVKIVNEHLTRRDD